MKQKDILYVIISSFIVIVIWIIANLLHIQNTSKLSEAVIAQSIPITPSFDVQTLSKLKERSKTVPLFTIKKTATPAATISPTQILTPTPSLSISPTVTPTISNTPNLSL